MLYLYQIFVFLLGHLHFFLHLLFKFMEKLFKKHPIPKAYDERMYLNVGEASGPFGVVIQRDVYVAQGPILGKQVAEIVG